MTELRSALHALSTWNTLLAAPVCIKAWVQARWYFQASQAAPSQFKPASDMKTARANLAVNVRRPILKKNLKRQTHKYKRCT